MGKGLTPFPYALIFPQDEHENLLIEQLATEGVAVERQTKLLSMKQSAARVGARLRLPDGSEETCQAAYVAGCDGVHSRVREELGIGFPGGTYEHLFYVADVTEQLALQQIEGNGGAVELDETASAHW